MTLGSAFQKIRQGQIHFFGLPRAGRAPDGGALYGGADAVILGVPCELGADGRTGASFAPYHVRRTSSAVQSFHPGHEIDVFGALRALDGGNIPVHPFDPLTTEAAIEVELSAIAQAEAVPFCVGGDRSITLPILKALASVFGPIACVRVSAARASHASGSDEDTGSSIFQRALSEGLVERGQLFEVRGWPRHERLGPRSRAEVDRAPSVSTSIEESRIAAAVSSIRSAIGSRPVYLSFNIDAVDPGFAPGSRAPTSGGLSAREALNLVRGLKGMTLVGMDVVDVCPALDHADMTTHLAAHLLYEGLALVALRR